MWETLALPWQSALEQAWIAYQAGCVPIGAVVTGLDGTILTYGRNHIDEPRPAAGGAEGVFHGCLAHAELNALIALDRFEHPFGIDYHDCALYTTTEPCPLCLGALYMSGVRSLHYTARDPFAGSTNLLGSTPYLSRKPIRVFGPAAPVLEDLVMALAVDYQICSAKWVGTPVYASWNTVLPTAVRLGEVLNRENILRVLAERKASTQEMVDQVIAWWRDLRPD